MHTSTKHDTGKASASQHDVNMAATTQPRTDAPSAATARWWHRLLRIEPIPDIHAVYDFFDGVAVDGLPVTVLSWPATRFHVFWPRPLKKLLPLINHAAMLLGLLRSPRSRPAVVREFDSVWFLFFSPGFWLARHRLVLNINQNITTPPGHGAGARALRILSRMGFRFLWLDGAAALPDVRAHFPRLHVSTPLFPVMSRRRAAHDAHRDAGFTVGLVGYFREDKGGVAKAVALAQKLATIPGVTVAAGFWNETQRREFSVRAPQIETCSTYETADYHAFLDRCHAVVVLVEREAYYFRHSGILMDCISHGTLPICPSYPLLESIVMRPVPVGTVYGEHENLRCVVWRVLAQYER
ncbi:MAG TPA: hypothetical protein VNT02_15555, partial [Burkholderiales bacterium]|nr:hypothetical protein [Burkholderiales bacterium]